jgi:hypothetical protein
LGSAIFNITREPIHKGLELHWDAGGVLSDRNGDDAYSWCYSYTVVFWMRNHIDFDDRPNDSDDPADNLTFVHGNSNTSTAVRKLPGSFTDVRSYGPPQAVLPRGYGLSWKDDDYNVLQVGFDLGIHSTSGNTIAWISKTLLKDNSSVRPYQGSSLVSVLSGNSVRMWQPSRVLALLQGTSTWVDQSNAFPLTARNPSQCLPSSNATYKTFHFVVEDVPFDHAVPVLTGWDLGNICDDTHVKRVGVWIEDFEYVRDPQTRTGTMTYTITSVFRDAYPNRGSAEHYKIKILDFNSLAAGPAPEILSPLAL